MSRVHTSPKLSQLDLNLLHVFDVVYRERNLSRAAALLSLTQPAVSHAIGRLRAQLDDPLFRPHGRGVAPTPLADRLAPSVRVALGALEDAFAHLREFDPRRDVSRFAIAVDHEVELLVLPEAESRFRARAPDATLTSTGLDRRRVKSELAQGALDLALDVAQPPDPALSSEPLVDVSFCVVASRARRIDLRAYLAARHVAVSPHADVPSVEDVLLGQQGLHRDVAVRCQRLETAGRIAATSKLLLTLPRPFATLLSAAVPVRIVDLDLPLPRTVFHAYWHRRRDADPAVLWMRDEIRQIFVKYAEPRG